MNIGIEIAARMPMIATVIMTSIRVNPARGREDLRNAIQAGSAAREFGLKPTAAARTLGPWRP